MRQVFLDTETTGLSADNGDRLIEIGCVEMVHRKLTGNNLHIYVNPGRDSHEEALKVHGLTSEFLSDKPKFSEIAQEMLDYLKDAHVVIHNAPFDLGFLNNELALSGLKTVLDYSARVTDTLVMAKARFPGMPNSLDALCRRCRCSPCCWPHSPQARRSLRRTRWRCRSRRCRCPRRTWKASRRRVPKRRRA